MQGLILAAGRGSRLGDKNGGTCKCLIEVGRKPLVEHQIEALARCGVGPVGMVVGYGADDVQEMVGIRAEYIRNPRWSVTNSLYSFWLARDWIQGDLVVLNCDVLFSPRIVERLLEVEGDALAYDSSSGERREEMSVKVVDGRLAEMSKTIPTEEVSGENVGILRLTDETVRLILAQAEKLIHAGRETDWLGSAVSEVARTRPIRAVDIHGLPWGEIDFPADLAKVRKTVWPAIRRAERSARAPFRIARMAALALVATLFTFASYRAWLAPQNETVWEESEAVTGAQAVRITDGKESRKWWLLWEAASATLSVEGPTKLRVNARPLFLDESVERAHFVLEVLIDGRKVGLYSLFQVPSDTWRYERWKVGKRDRLDVEIPTGTHVVTTTLAATDGSGCLLRFALLVGEL